MTSPPDRPELRSSRWSGQHHRGDYKTDLRVHYFVLLPENIDFALGARDHIPHSGDVQFQLLDVVCLALPVLDLRSPYLRTPELCLSALETCEESSIS